MTIHIKKLKPGDEAVLAGFAEAFDDPLDARATSAFLADARHHLFVGYLDETPAGFVTATELLHPDKARSELFLNEIAVVDAARRHGVARALIEALWALSDELGCRGFYVLAEDGDARAMQMYAATGGVLQEPPSRMYWYAARR
jgi:GNAT superfamily N-acetyltransferase